MPEQIRAVAYYRKSDEDDGESVEQQREWATQAAPREGVQIVREFTDQAMAGWDTANGFLLSGLVRCGHCEYGMIGRTDKPDRGSRQETRRLFVCGGYNNYGKAVCLRRGVDADALAAAVLAKLEALARDFLEPSNLRQLREEIARQDAAESGHAEGDGRRAKARLEQLERAVQKAADRVLDEENEALFPELRARLLARKQERDAARAEVEALASRPEQGSDRQAKVDAAVAMVTKLAKSIRAEDRGEVQAVLSEWLSRVEVWFRPVALGKVRTCNRFARGLILLREDVRLSYRSVSRAGPRESSQPGIYAEAKEFLGAVLSRPEEG
jgi:hypothetical protein